MSLKLKLISSISAFMLVLGMLLFGVFAATNVTIQMGGSLSFIATDVYARVTGAITGAGVGNQTLPTIEFSASNENPDQSGWQNLDLEFNTAGDPITIEVTVENLASDRNLTVNLQDNFTSSTGVLEKDVKNGDSDYTGSDIVLNASTGEGTSTTTFAITLSLSSKNNSLPDTEFGYTINLYDASYELPEYKEITGFSFSTNDDGTATVVGYSGIATDVVVPASFSIMTVDTGVAGYTETFNNMDEFTAYMNNQYNQIILMAGYFYVTTSTSERTFIKDFSSFFATLTEEQFPLTIEFTDYEITYEDFVSLGGNAQENAQYPIGKSLYEVIGGKVGNATIEFNSGETYEIDTTNVMEMGNEIMSSNFSENNFPIEVSYPSEETYFYEGDDYTVTSIVVAFANNTTLTSVSLPSTLTSIGHSAFYNCSGLTSITIPDSVTNIGGDAFRDCSSLEYRYDEEGVGYLGNDNTPYIYLAEAPTTLTSYTIKNTCRAIGYQAFYGCRGLTGDLVIPEGVTSIGYGAFYNCRGLTGDLVIPDGVTNIGSNTFNNCRGLTSITLPSSLTSIGDYAFSSCSGLTGDLVIPEGVTSIGLSAFYNCSGLETITFNTPYSWEIGNYNFTTIYATPTASEVQANALDYLISTYYNYYWRAVVE